MKLINIIERATDFGTLRSRKHFFAFVLKIFIYIIPATILGNFTDETVKKMKNEKILGETLLHYIIIQTFIIITTLYLFLLYLSEFISEFQASIAGSYFIVLYFGMQTNYIHMIKQYMNT